MDSDLKRFVDLLRERFTEHLQKKTGWGRNELMNEFNLVIAEVLLEIARQEKREQYNDPQPRTF